MRLHVLRLAAILGTIPTLPVLALPAMLEQTCLIDWEIVAVGWHTDKDFEVTSSDPGAGSRLDYVKKSLISRGIKKKVIITDRLVMIYRSDQNPERFSRAELRDDRPIIVKFENQVDDNLDGTMHGVISELYLDELSERDPAFLRSLEAVEDKIIRAALQEPRFQGKDPAVLRKQCRRILFMRTVWQAKQDFYEAHQDIRPPSAAGWSADQIKAEQLVNFYANSPLDPVDPEFAHFVLPSVTPGIELPFYFPYFSETPQP